MHSPTHCQLCRDFRSVSELPQLARTPKSPTGRSARRRPVSPDDAPPRPPPARGTNWPRGRRHGIAIRIPAPLFVKDASADRRRLAGVDQIPIRQLRTDLPVGDFGVRPTGDSWTSSLKSSLTGRSPTDGRTARTQFSVEYRTIG